MLPTWVTSFFQKLGIAVTLVRCLLCAADVDFVDAGSLSARRDAVPAVSGIPRPKDG